MGRARTIGAASVLAVVAFVLWDSNARRLESDQNRGSERVGFQDEVLVEIPKRQPIEDIPPTVAIDAAELQVLRMQVVDRDTDEPVQGAKCVVRSRNGAFKAESNGLGVVEVPNEGVERIEVTANGYVGRQWLAGASGFPTMLRLERAGVIRGEIRDATGALGPAGLTVVAYPESLGSMGVSEFLAGEQFHEGAEFLVTESDANGSFELRRVQKEQAYCVRAFGPGIVTEIAFGVQAGDERLTLQGGRVFGVELQILEEGGAKPDVHASFRGSAGISRSFSSSDDAAVAWRSDEWTLLAGMPAEYFDASPEERMNTMLAWTPFDRSEAVEVRYRWFAYGFEDLVDRVELQPIVRGIRTQTVYVRASGAQSGSLDLSVQHADAVHFGSIELARLPAQYDLQFSRLDGDSEPTYFELGFDPMSHERRRMDGIPAGQWKVKLYLAMGTEYRELRTLADSVVTILPGQVSTVELDLSDLGSVEFLLTDAELAEYSGPFRGALKYVRHEQEWVTEFRFDRPPYVLPALPPGDYALDLEHPTAFPEMVGLIQEAPGFHVARGEVVTVDCQVMDSLLRSKPQD